MTVLGFLRAIVAAGPTMPDPMCPNISCFVCRQHPGLGCPGNRPLGGSPQHWISARLRAKSHDGEDGDDASRLLDTEELHTLHTPHQAEQKGQVALILVQGLDSLRLCIGASQFTASHRKAWRSQLILNKYSGSFCRNEVSCQVQHLRSSS